MAPLNSTRLTGAKVPNDRWITVQNPQCAQRNMLALIDSEWLLIGNTVAELIGTRAPLPTLGVVPGYDGSMAAPHGFQSPVLIGWPADFQTIGLIPGSIVMSQSFAGVAGQWQWITGPSGLAGSSPIANTVVNLASPTTPSYFQLNPPTPDQTNTLVFISGPSQATLHYEPGFGANGAGPDALIPPGAALAIQARNGTWIPVASADGGATIP